MTITSNDYESKSLHAKFFALAEAAGIQVILFDTFKVTMCVLMHVGASHLSVDPKRKVGKYECYGDVKVDCPCIIEFYAHNKELFFFILRWRSPSNSCLVRVI